MHRITISVDEVAGAAAGALAAAALHVVNGWWLNSARGVVWMALALAALGLIAAFGPRARLWARARAIAAGAFAAMAVILFWTGPGTIWPIVLVFAAVISLSAVFAGATAGAALVRRRR